MRETVSQRREIDWAKLIDEALTAPGSMGNIYNCAYEYSFTNQIYLRLQEISEPIATLKRWNAIGRTVLRGSKAKEIIRPIFAKNTDEDGEQEPVIIGFKPVRCIFTLSQTKGDEMPPIKLPEWDLHTALGKLGIREIPFDSLSGNLQGYARGLDIAVSPIAINPTKTQMHEIGHILLGHTMPSSLADTNLRSKSYF